MTFKFEKGQQVAVVDGGRYHGHYGVVATRWESPYDKRLEYAVRVYVPSQGGNINYVTKESSLESSVA